MYFSPQRSFLLKFLCYFFLVFEKPHVFFLTQVEPRLLGQMKAVSAEYLGPVLDPSSSSKQQHITKSLASLTDIQEDGLSLATVSLGLSVALREPHYRERSSRTISLPVRGHTL